MGLEIIRNDAKGLTKGEGRVFEQIKKIYGLVEYTAYLYVQPTIDKLVPDFILMDPKRGLCILEVKDWSKSYIQDINRRSVTLKDREDENPIYKTGKYLDIAKGLIAYSKEDMTFIEDFIFAKTVMVNLTADDVEGSKLKTAFYQPPVQYLTGDRLKKLSVNDLYSEEVAEIDNEQMIRLRTVFFPESKIIKEKNEIDIFDSEQENFAKKIPYGHYMVTGVPGSGKTIILIARAIHLIKEHPEWQVVILAYNKSLASKIEEKLEIISQDYMENRFLKDIAIQNIHVKTFHKMAREVAQVSIPYCASREFWEEELPEAALKVAKPFYDAVLIDEYQDFRDSWIRLCIALCKIHTYKTSSGEERNGINLFMAGDRLQSIYNAKEHNWNDFGINMRGRSKLLKTSYRAGKKSVELALRFLMSYPALEAEVKRFYKEEEDAQVQIQNIEHMNEVMRVEGSYYQVGEEVNNLIKYKNYTKEDFLILCHTKKQLNELKEAMPKELKGYVYDISANKISGGIAATTYHSAKGLEAKIAILMDVDQFKGAIGNKEEMISRKLLYVGMTRASEILVLHGNTSYSKSYYSEIKHLMNTNL